MIRLLATAMGTKQLTSQMKTSVALTRTPLGMMRVISQLSIVKGRLAKRRKGRRRVRIRFLLPGEWREERREREREGGERGEEGEGGRTGKEGR